MTTPDPDWLAHLDKNLAAIELSASTAAASCRDARRTIAELKAAQSRAATEAETDLATAYNRGLRNGRAETDDTHRPQLSVQALRELRQGLADRGIDTPSWRDAAPLALAEIDRRRSELDLAYTLAKLNANQAEKEQARADQWQDHAQTRADERDEALARLKGVEQILEQWRSGLAAALGLDEPLHYTAMTEQVADWRKARENTISVTWRPERNTAGEGEA